VLGALLAFLLAVADDCQYIPQMIRKLKLLLSGVALGALGYRHTKHRPAVIFAREDYSAGFQAGDGIDL